MSHFLKKIRKKEEKIMKKKNQECKQWRKNKEGQTICKERNIKIEGRKKNGICQKKSEQQRKKVKKERRERNGK